MLTSFLASLPSLSLVTAVAFSHSFTQALWGAACPAAAGAPFCAGAAGAAFLGAGAGAGCCAAAGPIRPASHPGVCKREMPHWRKAFALLLACPLLTAAAAAAEPVHGIAMHGAPKYPSGFAHFSYVNPSAPKGGRLVLGTLGTFDSLN